MARGKGSNQPALRHRDTVELLRRLDVGRLKLLMEQVFPESHPTQVGSASLRMRCPTPSHPDFNPSFTIDIRRGLASCGSCRYATRNLLQLLQDCKGWSFAEGLTQVTSITGVRLVSDKQTAKYEETDQHREALRIIAWVISRFLQELLNPTPESLIADTIVRHTAQPTLNWLFTTRALDAGSSPYLPYGVWPAQSTLLKMAEERLAFVADEQYRAGGTTRLSADRREKILARIKTLAESVGPEWAYSVAYVYGHDTRTPSGVRLRKPVTEGDKDVTMTRLSGLSPDEPLGWFGLYGPGTNLTTNDGFKYVQVLPVEGENDAIRVNEVLLASGITSVLCIASAGHKNDTDTLAEAGIETVYALSDYPAMGSGNGESWTLHRLETAKVVRVRVFNQWDALRAGNGFLKDPDDVIRELGHAHFKSHVLDRLTSDAFISADTWAFDRATETARDVDGVIERTAIAAKYGACLGQPAELAKYLDQLCPAIGVSPGVVRAQIVSGQDDEAGFIGRIADTLGHDLYFLFKEDTLRGAIVYAQHRASQRAIRFPVDDGAGALSALANVVGDTYAYFSERIGLPTWLVDPKLESAGSVPIVRDIQKPLGDYTRIALQRVFHGLPSRDECEILGPGPHLVAAPEAPYGVLQYLNTGQRVFRGTFESEDKLRWELLPGPAEGRRLFTMRPQPYQGQAQTLEDLHWGNQVSLEDLSRVVHDLADQVFSCWVYRRGPIEAALSAAVALHLAAPHFCPDKLIIALLGPTTTGKSTYAATLAGGQYPELRLIDASAYQTDYSPASLYYYYDGSNELMALEEFSTDTQHRAKAGKVEDITELIRQAPFPGGAVIRRVHLGSTRVQRVHTNVLITSVSPATDIQDANRRLEIETVKVVGHADPAAAMMRNLGSERFQQIVRLLNLGIYHHYVRYKRCYDEVVKEFATATLVPFPVETRVLRHFIGPATMLAMVGGDWKRLVTECITARRDQLDAMAHSTPANLLCDTLLRTNGVRVGNNYVSVLSLLAEPDKWPVLNATGCGALYNDAGGYLVMDWIAGLSSGGVLNKTEPWAKQPYHQAKYQLDQHAHAVPVDQQARLGVPEFLRANGSVALPHTTTVLNLGQLVAELRKHYVSRAPQTPPGVSTAAPANNQELPPGLRRGRNL